MQSKNYVVLVVIVLLAVGITVSMLWQNSFQRTTNAGNDVVNPPISDDGTGLPPVLPDDGVIEVTHQFIDGVHTYIGTIPLPTPCHSLSSSVTIAESFPEQVTVDLSIRQPAPDVVCIQVIAPTDFTVSFEVNINASVRFRLDGIDLPVRIIPLGA